MTDRPSSALCSLDDALAQLLAQVQPLAQMLRVPTLEADRLVLAQDVVSALDVPGFDNSQMDGYALRSEDVREPGVVLQVTQRIAAGQTGAPLAPLSAARIFTGAALPQGADCVVMQEDCELVNECEGGVRIKVAAQAGQWVRYRGEDVRQGQVALQQGLQLEPAHLGLAASLGFDVLWVRRAPRVALFSTGDELVMPGQVAAQDLAPGCIFNSNRFFLSALLRRSGCEVTDLGIVPDQREATIAALAQAAQAHDVILTSGGVSVGQEDHIKPAVEQLGHLNLWRIAMKPGKPFAYGRVRRAGDGFAHFVGLPGNPVSSFVTYLLLVQPMMDRLRGMPVRHHAAQRIAMRADFDRPHADKRREFLRVKRNEEGGLSLFPNQNSSVLTSVVWADGLVDVAAGQTIARGDSVSFIPFSALLS